jgi:hypothetical protein
VSGSIDTLVWRNKVQVPHDSAEGIFIVEQDRPNASKIVHDRPTYVSRGNVIKENRIVFTGRAGVSGFSSHQEDARDLAAFNRFEDNEIIVLGGEQRRFRIGSTTMDLKEARSRGQELRSHLSVRKSGSAEPVPACPPGIGRPPAKKPG